MRNIFPIPIDETVPSVQAVLDAQGVPRVQQHNERITSLAREAIALYRKNAKPTGLILEVPKDVFTSVLSGDGRNEAESPVGPISRASTTLALFAVTIGTYVGRTIATLFQANDFALGAMVDAAASAGTELTAQALENIYRNQLNDTGRLPSTAGILRFSPGYCGWHISGQRTLFDVLRPGDIGVSLNTSFLMQPLKSISGVMIAGEKEIFYFDDTFSFCRDCADHSCRERIQTIMDH